MTLILSIEVGLLEMKHLLLIASIAGLSMLSTAFAAGDAAAGKTKAATCSACHGPDGNSPVPTFPKIAGQHAGYLAKQLKEFKSGERTDATMIGMVAPLSEQDMADLSAFYASQAVSVGQSAEDKVEVGQMVYRAGNAATGVSACAACHGPAGYGNPMAGFPSLGGQHADYTVAQLKNFRTAARANDAGSMMRNIAKKMSDAEIEAVAQYIQGLH